MGQQRTIAGRRSRLVGAVGAVGAALLGAVAAPVLAPSAEAQVFTSGTDPLVRDVRVSGDEVIATVLAPSELWGQRVPADAWTLESGDGPVRISATRIPPDDLEVVVVPDPGFAEWSFGARRTVARFVDSLPDELPVGAVRGTSTAAVVAPSADRDEAVAALQVAPEEGVDLLARLETAIGTFSQREDVRRAMVVLSSGGFELTPGQEAVVREAIDRSRIDTFAVAYDPVGVGLPPVFTPLALRGGWSASVSDERLLGNRLRDVRSELANRYEVRFRTPRVEAARVAYTLRVESGDVRGEAPLVADLRATPERVGRETDGRPRQLLGLVALLALTAIVLVVPGRLARRRADRRRRRADGPPVSVVGADGARGVPLR